MAKTTRGLGRGLDALLGGGDPAKPFKPVQSILEEKDIANKTAQSKEPVDAVFQINIADIDPNRNQPRRHFDEQALKELAESIKSVGVVQPIIVRAVKGRYSIIAGERRWRAARMAGLSQMPAIVREWDESKRLEVALVENLQRDDLNPIEQAKGIRQLMDHHGYTQEAVSERIGCSRPAVANLLRLLTLPDPVQNMLIQSVLSAGHGRALVTLKDAQLQMKLANLSASQGWSVRQLERICAGQAEEKTEPAKPQKKKRDPELNELERMARDVFGTRAQIEGDGEKGKLVLHYFGPDDLQRIWEILEFIRQGN